MNQKKNSKPKQVQRKKDSQRKIDKMKYNSSVSSNASKSPPKQSVISNQAIKHPVNKVQKKLENTLKRFQVKPQIQKPRIVKTLNQAEVNETQSNSKYSNDQIKQKDKRISFYKDRQSKISKGQKRCIIPNGATQLTRKSQMMSKAKPVKTQASLQKHQNTKTAPKKYINDSSETISNISSQGSRKSQRLVNKQIKNQTKGLKQVNQSQIQSKKNQHKSQIQEENQNQGKPGKIKIDKKQSTKLQLKQVKNPSLKLEAQIKDKPKFNVSSSIFNNSKNPQTEQLKVHTVNLNNSKRQNIHFPEAERNDRKDQKGNQSKKSNEDNVTNIVRQIKQKKNTEQIEKKDSLNLKSREQSSKKTKKSSKKQNEKIAMYIQKDSDSCSLSSLSSVSRMISNNQREARSQIRKQPAQKITQIEIPTFSTDMIRKIQQRLQKKNPIIKEDKESILYLMCAIWNGETNQYKTQIKQRKSSKVVRQEEIDILKCIRKLLQFYKTTNGKSFDQTVFIHQDIFTKNGIKYFNSSKLIKDLGKNTKNIASQEESEDQGALQTPRQFIIYKIYQQWLRVKKIYTIEISLLSLLVEIVMLSYDKIVLLDRSIAGSIILQYCTQKTMLLPSELELDMYEQLIIHSFTELNIIRNNASRSIYFTNKRQSEQILWKFFSQLLKIFYNTLKSPQFSTFSIKNFVALQKAYVLQCQFVHYMKKFSSKTMDLNFSEIEEFLLLLSQRIIEYKMHVLCLRDQIKRSSDFNSYDTQRIFSFKFQLPIYDWVVLMIKCPEIKIFQTLVNHFQRVFFQRIEETSDRKSLSLQKKQKDKYSRYTIEEDPNQDKSFFHEIDQDKQRDKQQCRSIKLKSDFKICHMKFLELNETIPESLMRKIAGKTPKKVYLESFDQTTTFLFILLNKEYIIKLIQEIEFVQIEKLPYDIGKGLVKLCNICNEFSSIAVSEKHLKKLNQISHLKGFLNKFFHRDIEHQRRVRQSQSFKVNNQKPQQNRKSQRASKQYKNVQKSQSQIPQQSLDSHDLQIRSCQTIFFQINAEIQRNIALLKLETYIEDILKRPQIFHAERYYERLLNCQHISQGSFFLQRLITKWINSQLRFFNILEYFYLFMGQCIRSQTEVEIQKLIDRLPIAQLAELHCLLLTESFIDQPYLRNQSPQSLQIQENINVLTSGGFWEKVPFIDKSFFQMSEILLWRNYLKPIIIMEDIESFICVKSYFSLIANLYHYSKRLEREKTLIDNLRYMIERLKIQIQKDRINHVSSIFHFLCLALLPFKLIYLSPNTASNGNSKSKLIQNINQSKFQNQLSHAYERFVNQIFVILLQNHTNLIEMFKNKQSITYRTLNEEIRRDQSNNQSTESIAELQDLKRKQVSKLLQKYKSMHEYLMKNISRFVENVGYTPQLLKSISNPEELIVVMKELCRGQHLGKQQKYSQTTKTYHTPTFMLELSTVSSNDIFERNFKLQMRNYDQDTESFVDKLGFFMMLRCIARKWINVISQEKQFDLQVLSKQGKQSRRIGNINQKQKSKRMFNLSLISVEKIFEICLKTLRFQFRSSNVRQTEVLKLKLLSLQTVCMLSEFISQRVEVIKNCFPNIFKNFKKLYYPQLSQIIIKLLLNNNAILGKDQKQLILSLRLKALCFFIQNYKSHTSYSSYEWKITSDKQQFWFIIYSLAFQKSDQIRFLLIKYSLSRFKRLRTSHEFRRALGETATLFEILVIQQPNKCFKQIVKKALYESLGQKLESKSELCSTLLLGSVFNSISFFSNLNTILKLQNFQKKVNPKQYFAMFIDMVYQKNDLEAHLVVLVDFLKQILQSNNQKITDIFKQLKLNTPFQIEFSYQSKAFPFKTGQSHPLKAQGHQKNQYEQLLRQIRIQQQQGMKKQQKQQNQDLSFSEKYQNALIIFEKMLTESIKLLDQAIKDKYAKSNKKMAKCKKNLILNFSLMTEQCCIFNEKNKNLKTFLKKFDEKPHERKSKLSQQEVQI